MSRTFVAVLITNIVCIVINTITPIIAYTQMNKLLSEEPECNGKTEPNFLISDLQFNEKSVSGLYVAIDNPTTQYWFRIISLDIILLVFWVIFSISMYNCCYTFLRSTPTITYFKRSNIIITVFLLMGVISSLTFLYGGPTFKNEFMGLNDSKVYIKNQMGYQEVSNLYVYKTYGADDCGGTPIATTLEMPIITRIRINTPPIIINRGGGGGTINDPCKKEGLLLVANKDFSGMSNFLEVGPWRYEILETRKWDIIQSGLELKPECLEKMEDIIVMKSGNLIIPILYIVAVIIIYLFPLEEMPPENPNRTTSGSNLALQSYRRNPQLETRRRRIPVNTRPYVTTPNRVQPVVNIEEIEVSNLNKV